jgi:hypothetical protein
MSYREKLHHWLIVRFLPSAQALIVARFRRRSEAEEYLRVLRRLIPTAEFKIVFAYQG